MSWQIINVEPAYGICDQCKKHDCGIVDGEHKWVMTGIYDKSGDAIVIGHKCVELWAANLGMTKEIVEVEVRTEPTEEELLAFVQRVINGTSSVLPVINTLDDDEMPEHPTDRAAMKAWLDERGITYFKGAKDDKLRELVLQYAGEQV